MTRYNVPNPMRANPAFVPGRYTRVSAPASVPASRHSSETVSLAAYSGMTGMRAALPTSAMVQASTMPHIM